MKPLTLIFPMAGRKERIGYKYMPFLTIGEKTLIEAAFEPFRRWVGVIDRVVFVYLKQQQMEFEVHQRLGQLFPDLHFDVAELEHPTRGPAETVARAISLMGIAGRAVVCDCDHSIDVDSLMELASSDDPVDCAFPVWELRGEDLKSWSVASVGEGGAVLNIAEKRLPAGHGDFVGVIGCYYFSDVADVSKLSLETNEKYLSGIIRTYLAQGRKVRAVRPSFAEFYGDRERLRQSELKHNLYAGTVFCDIDGTLIEHQDNSDYSKPLKVLPGSVGQINQWMSQGYQVVLITARDHREEEALSVALRQSGIPFHRIITGLPSGRRYLINDRKPSSFLTPQAAVFEIDRDQGIAHLQLPDIELSVLKRFQGGSLAQTLLVEDQEKLFIRKWVSKRENLSLGYAKLRNQYRTMERFLQFQETIVPALYGETDNAYEYYYDMEYLQDYRLLSQCSEEKMLGGLDHLLKLMQQNVFSKIHVFNDSESGNTWLAAHCSKKIYPRLEIMLANPRLSKFVEGPLIISGKRYPGLSDLISRALSKECIHKLSPSNLRAIHGDLTLENVMYFNGDLRLIDMDGAEFFDAPELDLGKLFQSLFARYETWSRPGERLLEWTSEKELRLLFPLEDRSERLLTLCLSRWSEILNCSAEQAFVKGLFFMGLHLIRMVPFRLRVSEEQAEFAAACAVKWIDEALRL